MLPGFVDEHIHIDMVSENRMNVTFDPTKDYETFEATITRFLADNPDSKWVYGGNLDWLKPNAGTIDAFGKPAHKRLAYARITGLRIDSQTPEGTAIRRVVECAYVVDAGHSA